MWSLQHNSFDLMRWSFGNFLLSNLTNHCVSLVANIEAKCSALMMMMMMMLCVGGWRDWCAEDNSSVGSWTWVQLHTVHHRVRRPFIRTSHLPGSWLTLLLIFFVDLTFTWYGGTRTLSTLRSGVPYLRLWGQRVVRKGDAGAAEFILFWWGQF